MRWRIPLVVALAAFVAVSCDQQPVEPAAEQVAEATFDFSNNPDNGNPNIIRGEWGFLLCWSDAQFTDGVGNGLRACAGVIPLSDGTEPDCGLQEEADPIWYQDVGFFEDFDSWQREVAKGDVFITVRDETTPGDCAGDALVAEGWGKIVINDNNWTGTLEGPNKNVWKFKSHSNELMTPGGDYLNFNGKFILHYLQQKDHFYVSSATVNVH